MRILAFIEPISFTFPSPSIAPVTSIGTLLLKLAFSLRPINIAASPALSPSIREILISVEMDSLF